ncbi:MAG: D-alanyl-D-alanine carboxypeptidase family protein [Desulfomonilaceae bacterium]
MAKPKLQAVRPNDIGRPLPGRVSGKAPSVAKQSPAPNPVSIERHELVPAYAPANPNIAHVTRKAHVASGAATGWGRPLRGAAPIEHKVARKPSPPVPKAPLAALKPRVNAKAMFCLDCSSDKVMLAENISEPLPIASITKLLTAVVVLEEMNLDQVLAVPADIDEVERHKVGLRPADLFTVRDLLHGMLIASGNDCAEVLARAYPKGGKAGFMVAMNRRARQIGASRTDLHTPSGLDMKITLGRKDGRDLEARRPNTASAKDVALIAREAFKHPLIRKIAAMKTYTMQTRNATPRDYPLASNDKLLAKNLPVAGAKTGFTNAAGRCIVALFKDQKKEHVVVVLNTLHHFKAAEKIYRWASARTM